MQIEDVYIIVQLYKYVFQKEEEEEEAWQKSLTRSSGQLGQNSWSFELHWYFRQFFSFVCVAAVFS